MKNILTFGSCIYYKRKENLYSLRYVAEQIGITSVYLSELENSKKSNPSIEIMQRLIRMYDLDEDETALFYDLHANANGIISRDLTEYIMEKRIVRKAIRTAKKNSAPDEEWKNFTERLNKLKKD